MHKPPYSSRFLQILKKELVDPSPPLPKPQTRWEVGKCVIHKKERSVGWNDTEVYYEVSDSGSVIGEFPTFMRAENYAKRET